MRGARGGAFVLKSGSWAEVLLRQLALSIFDNEFLEHSPCSTRGLDPQLGPGTSATTRARRSSARSVVSIGRSRNPRPNEVRLRALAASPLGGVLPSPTTRSRPTASTLAVRRLSPRGTCFRRSRRAHGLLVFNCMGGTAAEKVLCVEWATAFTAVG